ncbi:antiterminator Q family protein [Dickeya solani]|uniref:Antiterminator Q family protein n=1 Tax=Dickeya solani TaxID=1089444 RepID=A0ABU4EKQ4_9GAMM|nr:antiterminator Q family protein [Dickeya solani]MCZ0823692.1 antiterminator Q family protein [Dickeya solani]MDV6995599.1 antiterminator Q family protein [Dickeya solani]MDV7002878.1 antiterminator Q family protein [Dickeya solani]MDV7036654.1 antiterminator Q family protein [Dickeya solani]MDV7043407.1 antiterminator Q family protein [Dickeya solani]
MRDIQLALERWGAWAADDSNGVDYSHIAAGFKGLLQSRSKSRESCCDNDALIIDAAVTRLKQVRRPEELQMIVLHYIYNVSKCALARRFKCSEGMIRIKLQIAEGFIDGCLAMTGAALEMDASIQKVAA